MRQLDVAAMFVSLWLLFGLWAVMFHLTHRASTATWLFVWAVLVLLYAVGRRQKLRA